MKKRKISFFFRCNKVYFIFLHHIKKIDRHTVIKTEAKMFCSINFLKNIVFYEETRRTVH